MSIEVERFNQIKKMKSRTRGKYARERESVTNLTQENKHRER